jgi:hypothetical protein
MQNTSLGSAVSLWLVVITSLFMGTVEAWAQDKARKAAPAGQEIVQKAKTAKLERARATTVEFKRKKIAFTPANLDQVKSQGELEAGQVIGLLETEAVGDETGLPPGNYNVFAAKVGDQWHAYAEAGGVVVKEAVRVRMERATKGPADLKPEFRAEGWCIVCWVKENWGGVIRSISFQTCW